MKATTLCLLILLSFEHAAIPCINVTGTKYNGESTSTSKSSRGFILLRYAMQKNVRPDGIEMEATLRGCTNFNDRSDYSVALMYLGKAKEAVELLEQLEKEGIRRNPYSHEGTEWLHVKILEAKIAQQKDSRYFESHSVLNLRPEQIEEDLVLGDLKLPPAQVAQAISYQLGERLKFVKPPDAAVASLLFDFAAIEAATATLESAKKILQMAVEYGYPIANVQPLMSLYDRRIAWRKTKHYSGFVCLGLIIFGVGLLWRLYRRGLSARSE
jgi:hypothetical protein